MDDGSSGSLAPHARPVPAAASMRRKVALVSALAVVFTNLVQARLSCSNTTKVEAERDKIRAERDKIQAERGKVEAERDKLTAERDALAAELDKTTAGAARIKQDTKEGESRAMFLWLQELRQWTTPEQQASVLSAAIGTTPYESVKAWAKSELATREQALAKVAEQLDPKASTRGELPKGPGALTPKPLQPVAGTSKAQSAIDGLAKVRELTTVKKASCARVLVYASAFVPDLAGGESKELTDEQNLELARRQCANERPSMEKIWNVQLGRLKWTCECV